MLRELSIKNSFSYLAWQNSDIQILRRNLRWHSSTLAERLRKLNREYVRSSTANNMFWQLRQVTLNTAVILIRRGDNPCGILRFEILLLSSTGITANTETTTATQQKWVLNYKTFFFSSSFRCWHMWIYKWCTRAKCRHRKRISPKVMPPVLFYWPVTLEPTLVVSN